MANIEEEFKVNPTKCKSEVELCGFGFLDLDLNPSIKMNPNPSPNPLKILNPKSNPIRD